MMVETDLNIDWSKAPFENSEHLDASLKEKIFKNYMKCIQERSLDAMQKAMYDYLHLYCDFIAHYNINGFKDYYRGERFLEFVEHFANPDWMFRSYREDLAKWMRMYAKEQYDSIIRDFKVARYNKKVDALKALAADLGYKIVPIDSITNEKETFVPRLETNGQATLF